MGFREGGYEETRARLEVDGSTLRSLVTGESHGIGTLELVSLSELRDRARSKSDLHGRLRVEVVTGDVGFMHQAPAHAGALFQVASQFNLLEMVSPDVTPEQGVTRYRDDPTQGPACAIAAGAATIYRNYFVPVDDVHGQTAERQLDGLADLGAALGQELGLPVDRLWRMQNGYALATRTGLDAIAGHLETLPEDRLDGFRENLRIGVHRDVEVTTAKGPGRPLVSQAFCSALPVAYGYLPAADWRPFAQLVLEAAYEATMWAALLNARRGVSNVVFLTLLGGGAFGNRDSWIDAAIRRALTLARSCDLDVKLVPTGRRRRCCWRSPRIFRSSGSVFPRLVLLFSLMSDGCAVKPWLLLSRPCRHRYRAE